jgi:VCBS repeat-containing protein
MTAVSSYSATGSSYIDGILTGTRWASTSLTFSFPTSSNTYEYSGEATNGFRAFTAVQQDAIRDVLANFSAVSNLTFTEITETSSQHATLRFAESNSPSTAWAYYPSTSAQGGDAWFGSMSLYDNPLVGSYGYLTMLHETGHALGLSHAHESIGGFGTVPLDRDSLEYTVMSYRSYVGGPTTGYTVGSTSYPQTLMMYDIAAIQHMYGADYSTNSTDTTYRWNPLTGEMSLNGVGNGAPAGNRILMTVWDGGGNDTYDLSNYGTGVSINLQPGEWTTTSTAQLSSLGGGHTAVGNIANALLYNDNTASLIENAIGGIGNDTIIGNVVANRLTGGGGNDLLDGGLGSDSAAFSGLTSDYLWIENGDGSWTVTDLRGGSPDGIDTLLHMETLLFIDGSVSLGGAPLPPPPVTNAAPIYTSAAPSISLTEWANNSTSEAANIAHTAADTLWFVDADLTDVHTATAVAQGSGYLGSFSLTDVDDATGSLGWSFSVADNVMDYLRAGQSLTQRYDVTLIDDHGGTAVQTVTVTLIGADDGTVKTAKGGGSKGRGGGNDHADDVHAYIEMQRDQAPAPVFEPDGHGAWQIQAVGHNHFYDGWGG